MSLKNRLRTKVGLSASIDARIIVKLEDIAIDQRRKFSPVVQDILELGLSSYEENKETREFKRDLEDVKAIEKVREVAGLAKK